MNQYSWTFLILLSIAFFCYGIGKMRFRWRLHQLSKGNANTPELLVKEYSKKAIIPLIKSLQGIEDYCPEFQMAVVNAIIAIGDAQASSGVFSKLISLYCIKADEENVNYDYVLFIVVLLMKVDSEKTIVELLSFINKHRPLHDPYIDNPYYEQHQLNYLRRTTLFSLSRIAMSTNNEKLVQFCKQTQDEDSAKLNFMKENAPKVRSRRYNESIRNYPKP